MKNLLIGCLGCLFAATALSSAAFAADDEDPVGELRVTMNAEYVKIELNGEEWTAVEFERNGKVVIVKNIDLSGEDPVRVKFIPAVDDYDPIDKEYAKTKFKRKIVRRDGVRFAVYRLTTSIKFKVRKPGERPAPKPADKPDDKPKPDEPKPDEPKRDEGRL